MQGFVPVRGSPQARYCSKEQVAVALGLAPGSAGDERHEQPPKRRTSQNSRTASDLTGQLLQAGAHCSL